MILIILTNPIAIGIGTKFKQNEKANQKIKPQQEDDFKSQVI